MYFLTPLSLSLSVLPDVTHSRDAIAATFATVGQQRRRRVTTTFHHDEETARTMVALAAAAVAAATEATVCLASSFQRLAHQPPSSFSLALCFLPLLRSYFSFSFMRRSRTRSLTADTRGNARSRRYRRIPAPRLPTMGTFFFCTRYRRNARVPGRRSRTIY